MTDLHELGVRALAAAVRGREVSAVEVAGHVLDRAGRIGPSVGAFAVLAPDRALAEARAADAAVRAAYAAGEPARLPGLTGVPVPAKGLDRVAGLPWTRGSAALAGEVADVDDGVVTSLRDAGAVVPGTTSTPELGLPCYTEPEGLPPARTPWDLSRGAGGSSGGAAAAGAAGLVAAALGSDGGGSIRIPAACCGLVGLKPSRGRVSFGPHGVDLSGLAVHGALTRDVRDTALLLDVLAGPRPGDPYRPPPPRTSFLDACDRDPGSLRVGVLTVPVVVADAPVDAECRDAVDATARVLESLGHRVEPAPPPFPGDPAEMWGAFEVLWAVLAAAAPVPPGHEHLLRPLTRWLRGRGAVVSGPAHLSAVAAGQVATRAAASAWAAYDVVLTPTVARLPPLVGELRDDADPAADFAAQTRFTPWTSVWNLTGAPSISLPLHRVERAGRVLPVGVALGGRPDGEEQLLALAAQLEAEAPWPLPPMPD
ncbi:MAG TPA: amidase [Jiangellales bacterium]|nr:amidase [Jiangellales bacterium]